MAGCDRLWGCRLFPVFLFGARNFSHFLFCPENFWIFQILRQFFLAGTTFEPEIFGNFRFQTEKRSGKIQLRRVSGRLFSDGDRHSYTNGDPFFQLSRRIFLDFSIFNPKIFRFFNFRTGNFCVRKFSNRKKILLPDFSASVPGRIGRSGIYARLCAPSEKGVYCGQFSGFWYDRPKIF